MLTLIAATPVRADVVAVKDRPAVVNVDVLSLRDGELEYRFSTGRLASRAIEELDYLQISGWPLFNLAEKQQRDGRVRQAIGSYEKALSELSAAKASAEHLAGNRTTVGTAAPKVSPGNRGSAGANQLDRALLLRCRLLRAYDADGQFDLAVAAYLQVLESSPGGPAYLEHARPTNLPAAGSTFLAEAARLVEAALDRHGPDAIGLSLARWRNTWPDVQSPAATVPAGQGPTTRPVAAGHQPRREELTDLQALIDAGRFDEALQRVDQLHKISVGAVRADLYYWQARALLGKNGDVDSAEARRDRQRAGLALMRVVIHFPDHPLAPECLHRAAQLCQRAGRPEPAAALWSELIEKYPAAVPWSEWARQQRSRPAQP